MSRRALVVGGAPRLAVDAVRFLSVRASGATACALASRLRPAGIGVDLLLGTLAEPTADALRYDSREDLEAALRAWLALHPGGVLVMSAAINDYTVDQVEAERDGATTAYTPGAKVPSGADALVIRLRPASKVIDQLRGWGHTGPLVGFKYEAAATVIASAQALRTRTGAALVVANSLDGAVQALVGERIEIQADRQALLQVLVGRIIALACS